MNANMLRWIGVHWRSFACIPILFRGAVLPFSLPLFLLQQPLNIPVEIALEQAVLHDAVFLELALGVGPGDFRRDLAGVLQNLAIPEPEKAARVALPNLPSSWESCRMACIFRHVQVGVHDAAASDCNSSSVR